MKSIFLALFLCVGTLQAQFCNLASYGYSESFEYGLGLWSQETVNDNANWTRRSGSTPSSGTGPSSAHHGSYYMYIEASGMANFSNAILNGPCIFMNPSEGQLYAQFYYHMYGSNISFLSLETSVNNGPWNSIWVKSGNQGNSWKKATIAVNYTSGAKVRFRFRSGRYNGFRGDVAIDDFYLGALPFNPGGGGSGGGGGGGDDPGDGGGGGGIGIGGPGLINPNSNFNQTLEAEASLSVAPNPFQNELNIQTTLPNVQGYRLTNLQGITVQEGRLQHNIIGVQDLPAGVYFITVYNSDQQIVQKVVKQ